MITEAENDAMNAPYLNPEPISREDALLFLAQHTLRRINKLDGVPRSTHWIDLSDDERAKVYDFVEWVLMPRGCIEALTK